MVDACSTGLCYNILSLIIPIIGVSSTLYLMRFKKKIKRIIKRFRK